MMFLNCVVGELLRAPWTARRSNQSILKEISPEYWLEGLMLKLKLNTLATWCKELTHWKRPWSWEWLRAEGKGATEDEMVGWHHQSNAHEFEQISWDSEGEGSLACCSPWGHQESYTTEQLSNNITKILVVGGGLQIQWCDDVIKNNMLPCLCALTLASSWGWFPGRFLMVIGWLPI